jgi:hypothetical protein
MPMQLPVEFFESPSPTRFGVQISAPIGLNMNFANLEYYCVKAVLPGRAFSTTDYMLGSSPAVKVPYRPTYTGGLSLTFRVDKDAKIIKAFNDWQLEIWDQPNGKFKYYDDYVGSMIISVQNKGGTQSIHAVEVTDVYPVTILPIDLGHDMMNTYMTQTVEFAFHKWTAIM